MVADVWLVVGLGNPGPREALTRHNAGYLVLDELAERMGLRLRTHKTRRADVAEGRLDVGGPRCYMNESGGPVKVLRDFYKVPTDRLVVVHDEIDLPFGALRVKYAGGDNGHNGLKSIRAALGTGDFHRIRVGVGRPQGNVDMADHVLSGYSAAERRTLGSQVERAAAAVESLTERGLDVTQAEFNR